MLGFLCWVAAVVSTGRAAPSGGYGSLQAAAPIVPRTPLQPCFAVFKLANDTPPTEFRYVAGGWRAALGRSGQRSGGWWSQDEDTQCVFVLEGPERYHLSLQLHDVDIPQSQPSAAGNCSSGAPAVRVYNYTRMGELTLAAELCQTTDHGRNLSLPTSAAVVTTTLVTGRFDLLARVVAPPPSGAAAAVVLAPTTPAPAPASAAGYDYEQAGAELEPPAAPAPSAYDEIDDLNAVDGDLPQHDDADQQPPPR